MHLLNDLNLKKGNRFYFNLTNLNFTNHITSISHFVLYKKAHLITAQVD